MEKQTVLTNADYARAEKFLPWNADGCVYNARIQPYWLNGTGQFWYLHRSADGCEFLLVDPGTGTRRPAFDHDRLAATLSAAAGVECDGKHLPFQTITLPGHGGVVEFSFKNRTWQVDLAAYTCTSADNIRTHLPLGLPSPDGKWVLIARDHNLYLYDVATGTESALTTDGEPHYDYASSPESNVTTVTNRRLHIQFPPVAVWSPDSKKLITHRLDSRHVKELHLLQAVPEDGSMRPVLHPYRFPLRGEEPAQAEMVLFDVENRLRIPVQYHPMASPFFTPIEFRMVWWTGDSKRVYMIEGQHGGSRLNLVSVQSATGATRIVLTEVSDTRAESNLSIGGKPVADELARGSEVLWFSERDGWGHLYVFDASTGQVKRQLTRGAWVVRSVVFIDRKDGWIYFLAGGREPGVDPYYRHLYRVRQAGGKLQLLTPEPADHEVTFSPDGACFVDYFGTADGPTTSQVRSRDGKAICALEQADFSYFHDLGWRWPETFKVKGRDGKTDIYGTIYLPTNFDSSRKYPVIDDIYGGSQMVRVIKSYPKDPYSLHDFWMPQALAELGFVVVAIDGMGTPCRSKAFHDVSFDNMADGGGLPDHIATIKQLAAQRPYMDLDRVGISGHSAGGYNTVRALGAFPEFFKVGVATSGSHEMRNYLPLGTHDPGRDNLNSNLSIAASLEGKLLLVHGELDDNVHPSHTIKLVDALIKANKDFDLLLIPNQNHNIVIDPYYIRRRWDYFVTYLAGCNPPHSYRIGKPTGEFAALIEMVPPSDLEE